MKRFYNFLAGKTSHLLTNKRGVAAVEFALILPVMVVIYISTVEVSMAIAVQRKVAIASGTIGDLTAQYDTMNYDTVSLILGSSLAVLQPYVPQTMTARISSVIVDGGGVASIGWSYNQQRTPSGNSFSDSAPASDSGSTALADLPSSLLVPNTSVIVAEIDYTFTSPIGALLPSNQQLTQKTYFRPRAGTQIPFESSTASTPWSLLTSGPTGAQLNPTYIGFGAEYNMQPRTVTRDNNGASSTDSPPPELTNAYDCQTSQPACNPGGAGGGAPGDPTPGYRLLN
jgi:Flp pilus assembly protein TadG